MDCGVPAGVASLAVAGCVTVGVASPAVAGVASLADAGVASLAVAGGVTVGVASPAVAGVASLADAGVASLAVAGGVTVGVASPAVAGVASLAYAGVVYLADAWVASLAVAGVTSLAASAEVVPSADIAGNVAVGVTFLADPVGVVTEEMTVRDGFGALDGSVCDCGHCYDGILDYRNGEDPGDLGGCPGGTFLVDQVSVITGEMTFRERCGVLGGSVYECDE